MTTEYTHLVDRPVDYPVFLSLPLTLSDLALATGEIPTEWFDRSLCNLWTDLRSALLYSATAAVERSGELSEVLH